MGQLYQLQTQPPLAEQLVAEFISNKKRIANIECGSREERIEAGLDRLFRFLADRRVVYLNDLGATEAVDLFMLARNWYGPARQVLMREMSREEELSAEMIIRHALAFLEERDMMLKRLPATGAPINNVVELFKQS